MKGPELHDTGKLPGSQLAERIDTTSTFLPQVLGPLVKAGWVESQPGPGGGYRLSVSLGDVSILEVVETVEGPAETGRCVLLGRTVSRNGELPGPRGLAERQDRAHRAAGRATPRPWMHPTSSPIRRTLPTTR